jgi:hypothetical protein
MRGISKRARSRKADGIRFQDSHREVLVAHRGKDQDPRLSHQGQYLLPRSRPEPLRSGKPFDPARHLVRQEPVSSALTPFSGESRPTNKA